MAIRRRIQEWALARYRPKDEGPRFKIEELQVEHIEEGSPIALDGWPVELPMVTSVDIPNDNRHCGPAEPANTTGSDDEQDLHNRTSQATGDESWVAGSFLPPAEPAPRAHAHNSRGKRADDLIRLVAAPIVVLCFERTGQSFTIRELWDRVPAPKPQYARLNAVGDVVGQGGGKRGLRLWKGAGGPLACQENAVIALRRMGPGEVQALAARLGFTESGALWAAVNGLPSAEQCTAR